MPKEKQLPVEKREILGRKVKNLRREGILPANIYGAKIQSLAVQLPTDEFINTFKEAGETELIYLKVKGEKDTRPVLIREVQVHPVTNQALHADFVQVDLSEETTATVPLEFVGEAPAVKEDIGLLLELMNELEVTCLPTDIPSQIEVDVSGLTEINQGIAIKDLKLPKKVKLEADPEELVCKIEQPKVEEEKEPEVTEEEAAEGEEDKGETETKTKGEGEEKAEKESAADAETESKSKE